ncbi:MAG TPA: hypothetical protein VER17_13665, partial [Tepidisphaeraceae bacterium]|nr:hypothetical protein [Tepidisphaeraceae bacterium]
MRLRGGGGGRRGRRGRGRGLGVIIALAAALWFAPVAPIATVVGQARPDGRAPVPPVPPVQSSLQPQAQPPSQSLNIAAKSAWTWSAPADPGGAGGAGGANIVLLDGPVTIQLDRATLSATQAVIWLEAATGGKGGQPGEQAVTVALLGNAKLQQPQIERSDQRMIVTGRVNGPIRITAENRHARDVSASQTYAQASQLRRTVEAQQAAPDLEAAAAP